MPEDKLSGENAANETVTVQKNSDSKTSETELIQETESIAPSEPLTECGEADSNAAFVCSEKPNTVSNTIDSEEIKEENEFDTDSKSQSDSLSETVPDNRSLSEVLEQYDIKLSAKKIRLLETYCQELWKINEHLNLTRHTSYEKFVTLDLLDAIHLADQLQIGEHVLDVGTGGGMPGVLLAILRSDITVELCDSTRKKTEALGQILDAMNLNLNVWYAKGENLLKVHRFHTIVIRAVSKLDKLLRDFSTVWFAFDRMLLIKGHQWVAERGEARHYNLLNNIALRKVDEYLNPGFDNPSVILQLCQKKRFEEIQKRESDRLEGKPIDSLPEMIGIESGPAQTERPRSSGKRSFSGKGKEEFDKKRSRYGESSSKRSYSDRKPYSAGRNKFAGDADRDSGKGEDRSFSRDRDQNGDSKSSSGRSGESSSKRSYSDRKPYSAGRKKFAGDTDRDSGKGESRSFSRDRDQNGSSKSSFGHSGKSSSKRSYSDQKPRQGGNRSGSVHRSFKQDKPNKHSEG